MHITNRGDFDPVRGPSLPSSLLVSLGHLMLELSVSIVEANPERTVQFEGFGIPKRGRRIAGLLV